MGLKGEDRQNSWFYKMTFIVLGISSLIGWNAVLSAFPYFANAYGDRVFNNFTIPLQVGNCVFGVIMPWLSQKVTLLFRIGGGMICLSVLLIFFPILAQIAPNDTGYTISMVMTFFIGSFNSIAQNSMIALAAQEGGSLNGLYWVATGLSGLSMAILAAICNSIFPPKGDEGVTEVSTILFFIFASLISCLAIFLSYLYVKKNKNEQESMALLAGGDANSIDQTGSTTSGIQLEEQLEEEENEEVQSFFIKVKVALQHQKFQPVFVWLVYVVTFMVFPNIYINSVHFKDNYLSKQNSLWGQQYLNLTYQIGDVSGKSLAGLQIFHNTPLQYILTILRGVFIFTGLMVGHQKAGFDNDWFPFVNMFLMSSTNGFATGGLMALGPKSGKGKISVIETIGFIQGFALTFGIATGSILAKPIEIN